MMTREIRYEIGEAQGRGWQGWRARCWVVVKRKVSPTTSSVVQ